MRPTRTILHPTDFSEPAALAFDLACALARDLQASLLVMHVTTPPLFAQGGAIPPAVHLRHQADLGKALRRLQPPDPHGPIEHRLVEGDPPGQIVRVAREARADLIVMGTRGQTNLGQLLMGSVAQQVAREASCPVITVHLPSPAVSGGPLPSA